MNYWLVVGNPQNWLTAFEHGNIWGLKESQRHLWESLNENDRVLFYATSPVSGIIGHGVVRTKFRQNRPLWPKEIRKNTVIWPLRFEFDVESCLTKEEWKTNKVISKSIWPRAGFQQLTENVGKELSSTLAGTQYATQVTEPLSVREKSVKFQAMPEKASKAYSPHDELQRKLVEMGKLQGYLAESEYPFDIGKLDVVWRRVLNSVPTYVFEVQVSGDVYHALAKLKHAFDLWNSHIFIVASEEERDKVENLVSGTFHEIGSRIRFIKLEEADELYKRKKNYLSLEKELGIF